MFDREYVIVVAVVAPVGLARPLVEALRSAQCEAASHTPMTGRGRPATASLRPQASKRWLGLLRTAGCTAGWRGPFPLWLRHGCLRVARGQLGPDGFGVSRRPRCPCHGFSFRGSSPSWCTPGEKRELAEIVQRQGLKLVKSVTKHLRYLCTGPNAGPAKVREATAQGATLLTPEEFLDMLVKGAPP